LATITDIISLLHPSSDSIGIVLGDTIWVLFNEEIDEGSVDEGNLLVEGPETDSFIGPDMGLNLPNVSDSGDDDQLASPGYKGIVPGSISFQKINLSDLNPYMGSLDTTGAGNLWRTKAIFTPAFPFQALTTYRVYLAGDENPSDTTHPTGVRSRTVFDGLTDSGNTGTGLLKFTGSYTGTITDTYHIQVTIAGASGTMWYQWWKSSDALNIHGPILSDAYVTQSLDSNVSVKFGIGNFHVGDKYTVVVKAPTLYIDNTYWDFTTGSGSIIKVPTSTSTSITGDPSLSIQGAFSVISMTPPDRGSNLPLTTNKIVLTFSSNIDPTTVNANTISMLGQASNGDPSVMPPREIFKDNVVSGKKITITF